MNPQPFRVPPARPGDSISKALHQLAVEERGNRWMSSDSLRLHKTPAGVAGSVLQRGTLWPHPWKVSTSGEEASVREGTVDDLFPTIKGVSLTGLDAEGAEIGKPKLQITGGPGERNVSYVCIEARIDLDAGTIFKEPDALIITHRQSLVSEVPEIAVCAIAQLLWADKRTLSRVFQVRHFNLRYSLVRATKETALRHDFT
jgi:hypothetical protein